MQLCPLCVTSVTAEDHGIQDHNELECVLYVPGTGQPWLYWWSGPGLGVGSRSSGGSSPKAVFLRRSLEASSAHSVSRLLTNGGRYGSATPGPGAAAPPPPPLSQHCTSPPGSRNISAGSNCNASLLRGWRGALAALSHGVATERGRAGSRGDLAGTCVHWGRDGN